VSDQQAPPQAAAAEAPPLHGASGPPAKKLHDLCLGAEKNLEQLATALSQAGADPGAVKAVSQMADACRGLLKGMAQLAQQEQPPEPKPHTMDTATSSMQQDLAARRGQ
jgi:uncharacterized membrane protein YccC